MDLPKAVGAAAIKWCGEKDRETFQSDIEYFRTNWRALPGLRDYVLRALAPADGLAAVEALRKEQTSSPNPYDDCAHFDDHAVNRFAVAMKGKLAAKRLQGRGGWQEPDVENGYLSRLLREHVDKGDPVDVANLAMMIHQRGERIGPENEGATCGAIERAEAERDAAMARVEKLRHLIPEVLASLDASGCNISLARDLLAALDEDARHG